jgi:phage terminase Nu1 subunit (DNA packaging protein)
MDSRPLTAAAERLSQSGLARLLGVKRQAVHDLVKRGIIAVGDDGLIDVAAATEAMAKSLRADAKTVASIMAAPQESETATAAAVSPAPTFAPPAAEPPAIDPNDATSYHVARTLREAAEARMAQLRLRVMAGELVEAERVRRAITTLAAMARSGFERVPDKLAERLAVLTDAHECHALIATEIDQVLADLAAGAATLKLNDGGV